MKRKQTIKEILEQFPKTRPLLPEDYQQIYEKHFYENRNGLTNASKMSLMLEGWLHKQVARTSCKGATLEIGAGSLNQFEYETKMGLYDVVEPYHKIYADSKYLKYVDHFYDDISEVPRMGGYDRIISVATFEHILHLPDVIQTAADLLKDDGVLAVSIPNEGRFLWKLAYKNITGREFNKKYGLYYDVIMRYEHVNTADEIEALLRFYFTDVEEKLFGITKDLSFYRFYLCRGSKVKNE